MGIWLFFWTANIFTCRWTLAEFPLWPNINFRAYSHVEHGHGHLYNPITTMPKMWILFCWPLNSVKFELQFDDVHWGQWSMQSTMFKSPHETCTIQQNVLGIFSQRIKKFFKNLVRTILSISMSPFSSNISIRKTEFPFHNTEELVVQPWKCSYVGIRV